MLSPIWPSTTLPADAPILLVAVVIVGPGILTIVALLLLDIVPAMLPFLTFAGSNKQKSAPK